MSALGGEGGREQRALTCMEAGIKNSRSGREDTLWPKQHVQCATRPRSALTPSPFSPPHHCLLLSLPLSRADPFCAEALSALVDNHMLTNQQELALIERLPLQPEDRWLALLYRAKCKKVREVGRTEGERELEGVVGGGPMLLCVR